MISASSLPETIASRYRPIRLIASGGMGTVYEVEHLVTGERLALKVLWSNANASSEALARFKHEVRASARIRSDHVVRVTDADVAPELGAVPFLVMELLEGTDLERAAAAVPPAPAVVLEWLRQVARAIDKAHRAGIVHRDLKPENLFLTTRGDGTPLVKILDFGIVKMIEEGTGATGTGQILGTPKYMAPEQATANAPITPATDRCAIGLIAYRLLTGESYYQGGVMVVLGELLHGRLQPPSERVSRLGTAFDAWFLKACHRNPGERFDTAFEQIEALAVALGLPAAAVEEARETLPPSDRGRARPTARRVFLASVSVMTVVLVVVVGVGVRRLIRARGDAALVCGLPNQGTAGTCGACMAQTCCKEAQQCSETEGCAQVERCLRACPSGAAACRARCYAGSGAAGQLQQAVETCRATACASQCLPPPWACLGHVGWDVSGPIPPQITLKTMVVCGHCGAGEVPIAGRPGGSPVAGASVRICSLVDPSCALPLTAATTDDNGRATLNLETSLYRPPLSVFIEYRKPGFEDTLVQLNMPPVTADADVGRVELLDEKSEQEPTAAGFGATYDPTRATVDVYASDCNGQPASKKVALTWLDRDDATVTRGYSGYTGAPFVMNLPVGAAKLTRIVARVPETNQLIATASVVIRPRSNTEIRLSPAP
jgi:hypothetical protein